jgi:chromosomal replication initiator protein
LWEATLGSLELQVSRPSYVTWLKDTVGLSLDDHGLVVGTPSPFVSTWLEKRMSSLIETTLAHVLGQPTPVHFQVLAQNSDTSVRQHPSPPGPVVDEAQPTNGHRHQNGSNPFRLNPRYTLDSFIVGESNQLAYAAAVAVSSRPGEAYNPLFLYGGVGLGKTHLLHAIGHASASRGLSYLYVSSEQFTNEFITSIQTKKTRDFREKYRTVDLLLIDDIQFIRGKDAIQEGFFHTFNDLHNSNRQIVIASDRPSSALSPLEDRLRSRFEWGLSADIQIPDIETRTAILQAKAKCLACPIPLEVLTMISYSFSASVRDLEGALNRVSAYADLTSRPVTIDLAEQCLADLLIAQQRNVPSPEEVLSQVCSYYDIDIKALTSKRRDRNLSLARQIAIYLLREVAQCSLKDIGALLGGRDHSSIRYSWQKIATLQQTDTKLCTDISKIRVAIIS